MGFDFDGAGFGVVVSFLFQILQYTSMLGRQLGTEQANYIFSWNFSNLTLYS